MKPSLDDLNELFSARCSARDFGPGGIPDDLIMSLISAACLAPSGQNRQPWAFHVVTGPGPVGVLADLVDARVARLKALFTGPNSGLFDKYGEFFSFFKKAPVVMAIFARPYPNLSALFDPGLSDDPLSAPDTTHIQSASAAVTHLLLAAEAVGLASCWLTNPLVAAKEISTALGVVPPWKLMCLVALGNMPEASGSPKPGGEASPKKRYPAERVTRFYRNLDGKAVTGSDADQPTARDD